MSHNICDSLYPYDDVCRERHRSHRYLLLLLRFHMSVFSLTRTFYSKTYCCCTHTYVAAVCAVLKPISCWCLLLSPQAHGFCPSLPCCDVRWLLAFCYRLFTSAVRVWVQRDDTLQNRLLVYIDVAHVCAKGYVCTSVCSSSLLPQQELARCEKSERWFAGHSSSWPTAVQQHSGDPKSNLNQYSCSGMTCTLCIVCIAIQQYHTRAVHRCCIPAVHHYLHLPLLGVG